MSAAFVFLPTMRDYSSGGSAQDQLERAFSPLCANPPTRSQWDENSDRLDSEETATCFGDLSKLLIVWKGNHFGMYESFQNFSRFSKLNLLGPLMSFVMAYVGDLRILRK